METSPQRGEDRRTKDIIRQTLETSPQRGEDQNSLTF